MIALLTTPFFAGACGAGPVNTPDTPGGAADPGDPGRATRASRESGQSGGEGTRNAPPLEATLGEATLGEATLGAGPEPPEVLLRVEGDPSTTFSGTCSVGGRESVLDGRVPKRFAFDPDG